MKIQKTILFNFYILLCILYSASCSFPGEGIKKDRLPEDPAAIDYLQWLKGKWKMQLQERSLIELWSGGAGQSLTGGSAIVSKNDTVWRESFTLQQNGSDLIFTVQKNDTAAALSFRFVAYEKGEFVFANLENNYPQRIIYKNPQPDFLCVRLEGMVNGKLRREDLSYVRIK